MLWWLLYLNIFGGFKLKKGDINEILTEGGRITQKLRPVLRQCHTRAQNSDFKNRIKNVASIQLALLEMIYQELVLDSSTTNHPDTVQGIRAMLLGAKGLVTDLWHFHARRFGSK